MSDHRDPTLDEFVRTAARFIEPREYVIERRMANAPGAEDVSVIDSSGRPILKLELPVGTVDTEDERWLLARARRLQSIEQPDLRLVS